MTLEQRIRALAEAIGADIKTLSQNGGMGSIDAMDTTFTPSGGISATDVQAALEELDLEKLPLSGGTLTGAITFAAAQTWPTFNQNTSGSAGSVAWSGVTGTPTTLSGYGITDAAASSHVGSTGTSHGVVTSLVAGFMSSADKTKLDGIASGGVSPSFAFFLANS